jgi:Toluene-4-monooxygenase system protein B (TmoB)
MPIPLYGFVEGDTAGLLMPAEEGDTIMELAGKLQDAASIRVVRNDNVDVVYDGKVIDPELTVVQAGLQALDRFDVIRRRTR